MLHSHVYTTAGGVRVERRAAELPFADALDGLAARLDKRRGALLSSSYDYPGRYKRWSLGFADPPVAIESRGDRFRIVALNRRGEVLLGPIGGALDGHPDIAALERGAARID